MKSIFLTAILFLITISATVKAADKSCHAALPYFHTVTTADGLPSNKVTSVCRDSIGFIWIGTDHGIARYDGNSIKIYSSTSSLNINCIGTISDRLLIATSDGLKLFNPSRNNIEALNSPEPIVNSMQRIDDSSYLLATNNGVYKLQYTHPIQFSNVLNDKFHSKVVDIVKKDSNDYWFITAHDLVRFKLDSRQTTDYPIPDEYVDKLPFKTLETDGKNIYIGSDSGLLSFNPTTESFHSVKECDEWVISKLSYDDNTLMIATEGNGLKCLDLLTNDCFSIANEDHTLGKIHSNDITTVLYDKGLLWTGTSTDGLLYNPTLFDKFNTLRTRDFDSTNSRITAIYSFPDNTLLLGTWEGLVYIDESTGCIKTFKRNNPISGLRSDVITTIVEISGKIAIGTLGGGIQIFDKQTLSLFEIGDDPIFQHGVINQIIPGDDNDFWIASRNGLYNSSVQGLIKRKYDYTDKKLPVLNVNRLLLDSTGSLWIASASSLTVMNTHTGSIKRLSLSSSDKTPIAYLYQDTKGQIHILTEKSIYTYDSSLNPVDEWANEELMRELKGEQLKALKEVSDNVYWIITDNSIIEYSFTDGKAISYTASDGIPTGGTFNADIFITYDSLILIANNKGVIKADLSKNQYENIDSSAPRIVDIEVDGICLDSWLKTYDHTIKIPSKATSVTFTVANLEYCRPLSDKFSYKIAELDTTWFPLNGSNKFTLSNLKPGNYSIQLRNDKSGKVSTAKIRISHTYNQLYPKISLYTLILIVCTLIIYQFRRLHLSLKRNRKILASTIQNKAQSTDSGNENKTNTVSLEPTTQQLLERLLEYMEEDHPYKNPKLTIKDVAQALETSDTELSRLLNTHVGTNWTTFLNNYRVIAVKEAIDRGDNNKVTLETIAEECGFGSKTSFYRVFKAITGITPLEYCQQQKSQES